MSTAPKRKSTKPRTPQSLRRSVKQAKDALDNAIHAYANASGGAQWINGYRCASNQHIRDEQFTKEMQAWRRADEWERTIDLRLLLYVKAVRALTKAEGR